MHALRNNLCFAFFAAALSVLARGSIAEASLIEHLTFDTDGTATVGTDATLGAGTSISAVASPFPGSTGSLFSTVPGDPGSGEGATTVGSFDWTNDTRTIAFWMKSGLRDDNHPTMISFGSQDPGTRFDIRIAPTSSVIRVETQGAGGNGVTDVLTDEWFHIAVVVPHAASVASDILVYLNGELETMSGFNSNAINTSSTPMIVGASHFTVVPPGQEGNLQRTFSGYIDDVRVYSSALSQSEIQALAIPEPASLVLMGVGGVLLLRRR